MNLTGDTRRAVGLLYFAGAVVLLVELLEILALVYPPHTSVASWRFGLLGVTLSRTAVFALADAMLLTAAIGLGHRTMLQTLGILHLVVAIVLLPAMVMYGLDVLVLRRSIRPEVVRGFDLTAARTLFLCLVVCLGCLLVFRTSRRVRSLGVDTKDPARGVLLTDLPVKETS